MRTRTRGGVFGQGATRHGAITGVASGTLRLVEQVSLTGQLSRARLRGLELESVVRLAGGVTLEVGGQVARGTISDGPSLDDIAAPTFSVTARKALRERGFAQVRVWTFAADTRPGPTEVRTPGATVVDIGAGWRLTRRIDLRVLVRNALDAAYYASPDPRWVHAPGRSASLTVVVGQ